ncbi:hypothetical protein JTB14_002939 [Gonioctena quinquepunctata]|nr:hypothetical protein JTB14_002939 [Gonioctena quinquepunctata]
MKPMNKFTKMILCDIHFKDEFKVVSYRGRSKIAYPTILLGSSRGQAPRAGEDPDRESKSELNKSEEGSQHPSFEVNTIRTTHNEEDMEGKSTKDSESTETMNLPAFPDAKLNLNAPCDTPGEDKIPDSLIISEYNERNIELHSDPEGNINSFITNMEDGGIIISLISRVME